jgi:hypothetical protein
MPRSITPTAVRWLVATILAAALAAATATAAGASTSPAAIATVPVTGTTSTGGTFNGTMSITGFAVQNGQLVALGTVSGTAVDPSGAPTAVTAAPAAAPVQAQQQGGCTLFSFSFGPFDINVAGQLTIHIEPIAASVTLNGLLGDLLCGLLGGGGVKPPPPPVPAA